MPTMLTFFLRWQIKSQWWRKKTKKQNRFFYPTIQVGLHFKITNTSTPKWLVLLGGSTYIQFLNSSKQKGLHKIDRRQKKCTAGRKKTALHFLSFHITKPQIKKRDLQLLLLWHTIINHSMGKSQLPGKHTREADCQLFNPSSFWQYRSLSIARYCKCVVFFSKGLNFRVFTILSI